MLVFEAQADAGLDGGLVDRVADALSGQDQSSALPAFAVDVAIRPKDLIDVLGLAAS